MLEKTVEDLVQLTKLYKGVCELCNMSPLKFVTTCELVLDARLRKLFFFLRLGRTNLILYSVWINVQHWYLFILGCGGNFTSPTGTITSKNYPEAYPTNSDCTWRITVQERRTVQLSFQDFDVEGHSTCNYDRVTVSVFFPAWWRLIDY